MSAKEFEDYLIGISTEEHNNLIQERIKRLNPEQQKIAQVRDLERREFNKLIDMMADPDPDVQEFVFNSMLHMTKDECEHGRSYAKHCSECAEMDHLMFPELFTSFGDHIESDMPCAVCGHINADHSNVCHGEQPDDSGMCGCDGFKYKDDE